MFRTPLQWLLVMSVVVSAPLLRAAEPSVDSVRQELAEIERLMEELNQRVQRFERQVDTSQQKPNSLTPDTDLFWKQLGVRLEEIEQDGLPFTASQYRGALKIVAVRAGGPAARKGMREGDLLVGLHTWETVDHKNLHSILLSDAIRVLATVKFYILRDGEMLYGFIKPQRC